ncbi:hypothetical protein [Candidatus Williamhamiltonella defendens]|uniref:hypothetical protein n=1 Tax=Candidatus Williamhamiltonella defendens TaxID=138072 RepID=UPI001F291C42|nr:hypothetical protein [Candidatus Hamiltonella defensa]
MKLRFTLVSPLGGFTGLQPPEFILGCQRWMIGYFALLNLYWGFKFLFGREGVGSGGFLLFSAL